MNIFKIPRPQPSRTLSYSFSLLNLFFLARVIWLMISFQLDKVSFLVALGFCLLSFLLTAAAFFPHFLRVFAFLYALPGSILGVFGSFVILKRGLKSISQLVADPISNEIGIWFIIIFLWLGGAYLATFLQSLLMEAKTPARQSGGKSGPTRLMLIGFLVILTVAAGYWIYTQVIDPLPQYANYDPEVSYMLNAGTPYRDLELYKRMDHPGTPLQLIGTGLIFLLSPASLLAGQYPTDFLITHPGYFLISARLVILVLNLAVLYWIFRRFRNPPDWSSALTGLSAMIAYFSVHHLSFEFLTLWSPNSFNFAIGAGLLLLFYHYSSRKDPENRTLWIFSLAAGLAATFHVYMISLAVPVCGGIFILHKLSGKNIVSALGSALKSAAGFLTGYFIGTLVILPYYQDFWIWLKNILIHQGIYGTGEVGLISLSSLAQNFRGLITTHQGLFLILGAILLTSLIMLFRFRNDLGKAARIWALLAAVMLQLVVLLLIISKHPVSRYLLSAAALSPVLLILLHDLFEVYKINGKLFFSVTLLLLALLAGRNFTHAVHQHQEKKHYLQSYQMEIDQLLENYSREQGLAREDLILYWTYGTYSPCYADWLGNDFSKQRYTDRILELCPQDLQFDVWDRTIANTDQTGIGSLFNNRSDIVLIGNNNTLTDYQDFPGIRIIPSSLEDLGLIVSQQGN